MLEANLVDPLTPNDCDAWRKTDWLCDGCNCTIKNLCPSMAGGKKLCFECYINEVGCEPPQECVCAKCTQ